MSKTIALPAFAELNKQDVIEIDITKAYPIYINELSEHDLLFMPIDKKTDLTNVFSAEIARRCMANDLREIVGKPITIKLMKSPASFKWRLTDLPVHPVFGSDSLSKVNIVFNEIYAKLKLARKPV